MEESKYFSICHRSEKHNISSGNELENKILTLSSIIELQNTINHLYLFYLFMQYLQRVEPLANLASLPSGPL